MRAIFLPALGASLLLAVPATAQYDSSQSARSVEPALESTTVELTPTEADAIIRDEMEAREEAETARIAELESAPILERAEADMGNRKVVFNRVPTVRQAKPRRQVAGSPTRNLSDEELAQLRTEYEAKPHVSLFLSGTVYDHEVTELSWSHNGKAYKAFANVDLIFLSGIGDFDYNGVNYSLILAIGDSSRKSVAAQNERARVENWPNYQPVWVPEMAQFTSGGLEYLVVGDSEKILADDEAFAPIDGLLMYFQENEPELRVAYQRRVAMKEARERYLEANPPQPKDTIINFAPSSDSKSLRNR